MVNGTPLARSPIMPVDKSDGRIRQMFGEIAPWYDFLNHFLSLNIDQRWRRRVVRLTAPELRPGRPILDVCTGTGDLALAYDRAEMLRTLENAPPRYAVWHGRTAGPEKIPERIRSPEIQQFLQTRYRTIIEISPFARILERRDPPP